MRRRSQALVLGLVGSAFAACDGGPAAPQPTAQPNHPPKTQAKAESNGQPEVPANAQPDAQAGPEPELVTFDQLLARVKQVRGRGALVNVWATW